MTEDLYRYSIEQLAINQGSWPEIARSCGVSYSWICKFAGNKIPNASYIRVKRIASFLEGMKQLKEGQPTPTVHPTPAPAAQAEG